MSNRWTCSSHDRVCHAGLQLVQQQFMRELLSDSLAMAGAVMIRRIIGIAHIQDFKLIDSDDAR